MRGKGKLVIVIVVMIVLLILGSVVRVVTEVKKERQGDEWYKVDYQIDCVGGQQSRFNYIIGGVDREDVQDRLEREVDRLVERYCPLNVGEVDIQIKERVK